MVDDAVMAKGICCSVSELLPRPLAVMHVCGTHEASICRYGVRSLLPSDLGLIMGPGCPVCITPLGEIDAAIELAKSGVTVATYGDLVRVPGSEGCLGDCGDRVKVVQDVTQAMRLAQEREVVFFAVGFETTAPTTAAVLAESPPESFSVLCSHRLIPPAMRWLLDQGEAHIDGFLLPGHVSTIIGSRPYEEFNVPQVIAGFEPLDVLLGVQKLVKQIAEGRCEVENAYTRAVRKEGNPKALALMDQVFHVVDSSWRGFPVIPDSGLSLRGDYAEYDAIKKYGLQIKAGHKPKGCRCDKILRGLATPRDCPLFDGKCSPRTPVGPCMVSREGACRIWHSYE